MASLPRWLPLALACALATGQAPAQTVALGGMMGGKALLLVNGQPPKSLAPGESHLGVKLLSVSADTAVVEIAGKRATLQLGESPVQVESRSARKKITLTADSQGHFVGSGSINGQAIQFLVDTGATYVALGAAEADRLGLNYKAGQQVRVGTANGSTPGWRLRLSSLRIGEVELTEVEAVVTPAPMPLVLLGNSVLTQFQMTRLNDQMVLERRY